MPCIAAPKLPYPPGLTLLLPDLVLSVPTLGLNLCCTFETPQPPGFPYAVPLSALGPAIALVLQPLVAAVMAAIDQVNVLLDQLQFSCPLE